MTPDVPPPSPPPGPYPQVPDPARSFGPEHITTHLPTWATYTIALAAVGITFLLRRLLGQLVDDPVLEIFLPAIFLSAYLGGPGPGFVVTATTGVLILFFQAGPDNTPILAFPGDSAEWILFMLTGGLTSWLVGGLHRAQRQSEASHQLLAVTLASIGDAVITTDPLGRVTFLNGEAERLTAWTCAEALGRPLREVFVVLNEETRATVEDPAALVLRSGRVVGLANHTLLRARDGCERPIDDSGAPIRARDGPISGVVLVFRDISAQRRAEDERQRSEQTLRIFVEHAPAAIAMFDRSMRYLAVSRRFLSDYRLGAQDVIGRSHYEIFPEIDERWKAIHRRCLAGATDYCEKDAFPRADGSLDWVRWELRPWFERPNVVGGLVLFSEVVTERVRNEEELRASEARFHQTLDTMLEGCQIIGFDWRYLYVNDSLVEHGRTSREALLGRTMMEAYPGIESTPLFATLKRCMDERCSERIENQFVYSDGASAWFDLSIQPSREGIFILSIEISKRKEAEAALVAERAHLAVRVAEATADLRLANAELANAARLKDEFLATMSHELRTPLNAILGYTELLREGIYGPFTPKQTSALQAIERSGRHLLELISDILDLSKITAGRLELDCLPVNVVNLVQRSLHIVSQDAQRRRIALNSSLDPQVRMIEGDERRLTQILFNLLANAVKFTPEGGRVGLEVQGDPVAGSVTFTVWDTGIGIAEADLGQLFKPFSQIDSGLNRQYEGTGLGLALIQRLTQAHGGQVSVTSVPGQGSRFCVTLPWSGPRSVVEPPAPNARVPREMADRQGPSVLLAEDNEANSAVVVEHLSAHGFKVTLARDGLDAVAQAIASPPDLILMDVQMPKLDGLTAIRRLRDIPALKKTPIIALTALAMPGDRERCLEAGADAYLAKPISLRELRTLIGMLLDASDAPPEVA